MSARGPRYSAKTSGEKYYVTATVCVRGHAALRSTESGVCMECRRLLARARYAKNPTAYKKFRVGKEAHLARKAAEGRANETPERRSARLEKARVAAAEWRRKNPGHAGIKLAKAAYKAANKGKTRADTVKRRAAFLQRVPRWLDADDFWLMEQAYELAALRTKTLGFQWHVDHVVPLRGKTVSGLHVPQNLRVIPGVENSRKGNRSGAP